MIIYRFIFIVLLCFIIPWTSQAQLPPHTPQKTEKSSCSVRNIKNIKVVVARYLKAHTTLSPKQVKISPKRCSGAYAQANILPKEPVTDPATAYLHKIKGRWRVIALGTHFDDSLLRRLPPALRVE